MRRRFEQANAGRRTRLEDELSLLYPLPPRRLESCPRLCVRVDRGSTIHVRGNTYAAARRLLGERVEARLYAERVEVWYAQKQVESLPRLRGRGTHRIEYRHVIDWLVRKPGAFADYRYRQEMFPSSRFRLADDVLVQRQPERPATVPSRRRKRNTGGARRPLKRGKGEVVGDGVGSAPPLRRHHRRIGKSNCRWRHDAMSSHREI